MSSRLSNQAIEAAEDDLFQLNLTILAAEDWSHEYQKDPATLAKLIRLEAGMERKLRRYFRELSTEAHRFIDWSAYSMARFQKAQVSAADDFSVNVLVRQVALDESDNTFLKIIFEEISLGAGIGAQSAERIYRRYEGLTSTSAEIQRFAREQAASLVGKRIGKDGTIVDNPNAKYRISNTTREDIKSSIKTSLSLGENQEMAVDRLRSTINNPRRAELIAQTEAVNSYQGGLLVFGTKSGAVGKESQALNTSDRCADYAGEGIVPIDHKYDGVYLGPSYHPRCRCGIRLVFPEELA